MLTLGEECDVITKGTTPTSVGFDFEQQGLVSFVKVESIDAMGRFIGSKLSRISPKAHEKLKRSQLQEGDILFSIAGALGRTAIVTSDILPANTNQALSIIRLRAQSKLLPRFALSALGSGYALAQIEKLKGGVAQQNLSLRQMKDFKIPAPPLAEQEEIVEVLDKAFAAIDQAKANIEQNIANAKELFQSKLNQIFSQKGDGWEEKPVAEIAEHRLGKMLDKNKNRGEPQPYLRNKNVRWFNFELEDILEMKFESHEWDKYTVRRGDVVICEGGYPGRSAIWASDEPIFFQKAVHRVRFHEQTYNKWFVYLLFHQDFTGKLKDHFTGTGIQHFTGKALSKFPVPVGPAGDVENLIKGLDSLSDATRSVEHFYQAKLISLEELKKSILQKAFAGELT